MRDYDDFEIVAAAITRSWPDGFVRNELWAALGRIKRRIEALEGQTPTAEDE